MSRIILVDGYLSKEKLQQILRRHASKKKYKHTLADIWPKEGVEDGHEGYEGNRSSDE